MDKNLLIIFVKSPLLGKVKTRLAATIGDEKALEAYIKLLNRTKEVTQSLNCTKRVYYTWEVEENDLWSEGGYVKYAQTGDDLGERMKNAFKDGFSDGFENIAIIGSDCYELSSTEIVEAFNELNKTDIVIGPAADGGYYLLGMNRYYPEIFDNKKWSTESVFIDTIEDIVRMDLKHKNLKTLSDIDNVEDLIRMNITV